MQVLSEELMEISRKTSKGHILTGQEYQQVVDWLMHAHESRKELGPEHVNDWLAASRLMRAVLRLATHQEDDYDQAAAK